MVAVSLCFAQPIRADDAGALIHPRYFHTATLLADGRVLLAGGLGQGGVTDSCEIYDPAANSWTATGSLNLPRYYHSAVLLADGRVLVAGPDKSAEIYDPATGTWTVTQNMLTRRRRPFDPVLLSDGNVLAAGGDNQSATHCELYDPAAGKWSITGDLNEGRSGFRATLLNDGQVLVAGGYPGDSPGFVPDSELYDPTSGNWSLSGPLNRPRAGHVQLLLADGRVLIAGGYAGHPRLALVTQTAEIFDPGTGVWTLARPMNTPRGEFSATLLNDGEVFVAGGTGDVFTSDILSSIEEYDPPTGRWHLLKTTLAHPRWRHTTTTLLDGSVLVAGGMINTGQLLPDAERFVNPR